MLSVQIEENPAANQSEESASRFSLRLVLKACIFATGVAGIVAEYVMSTLATYLLGNAVLQWDADDLPDVVRHGPGESTQQAYSHLFAGRISTH